MEFRELTTEEYENFQIHHPYRYYLNSSKMIETKKLNGWQTYYVGAADDQGNLLAAAGFSVVPVDRKFHYAYAQRGILCDFNNEELLAFFTENLKKFCRDHQIAYIRMDPYVEYQELDQDGNVVPDGFNNQAMINRLEALGWHHTGFYKNYGKDLQVRYMVVLDLEGKSEKDILNAMQDSARRNVLRTEKMNLEIKKCDPDNLDEFEKLMQFTADKRGFTDMSLNTYQHQMRAMGPEGAQVWLAVMNCANIYEKCRKDREEAEYELNKAEEDLKIFPEGKKQKRRKADAETRLERIARRERETKELENKYGPEIVLSGAYFVIYDDEMYYISSGSYDELRKYCGPYFIQYNAIKYALEHHCRRYNFTGTSGIFDESADDYGVFLFKKRLGGRPIELLGQFNLVTDEKMMNKINVIDRLKKIIKK